MFSSFLDNICATTTFVKSKLIDLTGFPLKLFMKTSPLRNLLLISFKIIDCLEKYHFMSGNQGNAWAFLDILIQICRQMKVVSLTL